MESYHHSHRRRPGRPGQDKVHLNVTLSRRVVEAIAACESNTSAFLEQQALVDERVAAYVRQQGVCKAPGCKERIDAGRSSVYCAITDERTGCPGWFCLEHYAALHGGEEGEEP